MDFFSVSSMGIVNLLNVVRVVGLFMGFRGCMSERSMKELYKGLSVERKRGRYRN